MIRNIFFSLVLLTISFTLFGCGNSSQSTIIDPISRIVKDFEVVGSVRLQFDNNRGTDSNIDALVYDKLLAEAISKYKDEKVEVINIHIDRVQHIGFEKNMDNVVANASVIKYK